MIEAAKRRKQVQHVPEEFLDTLKHHMAELRNRSLFVTPVDTQTLTKTPKQNKTKYKDASYCVRAKWASMKISWALTANSLEENPGSCSFILRILDKENSHKFLETSQVTLSDHGI